MAYQSRAVREQRAVHYMRSGSTSIRVNASPDFLSESTRIPIPAWGFDDFAVWWEAEAHSRWLPAVGRAVGLIADPLASVPWLVLRDRQRVSTPAWIRDPQNAQRDGRIGLRSLEDPMTGPAFWMSVIYEMVLHGNAIVVSGGSDAAGNPLGPLELIPHGHWTRDGRTILVQRVGGGLVSLEDDLRRDDPPGLVLHFRGKPPYVDGFGMGVLKRYSGAFDLGSALDGYAASTFRSGVPTGYLKVATQATEDQLKKLKSDWLTAQNSRDGRTIAVLGQMVDFTPITIKPTDADLVKVSDLVLRGIAHAFGLSAHDLDVQGTSNTYANVQDRQTQRRIELLPWARLVESVLEANLPGQVRAFIALDGLERGNPSQQVETDAKAIAAGVLTIDEARERSNLPPLDQAEPEPQEVPA